MSIFEQLENGVSLAKLKKSDLLELLNSNIQTLSEKEANELSSNPNIFWFEFLQGDETASGNDNIFIEVQYKGIRYKGSFQIANWKENYSNEN